MSEALKPPSFSFQSKWLGKIKVRHLTWDDLPALEWEGEYTRFRRVYRQVYERMSRGIGLMWGADLQGLGLIGQAFVQFKNRSTSKQTKAVKQAYIHSFRVRPAYRRAGVGAKIMDMIEGDLVKRGFESVSLNVNRQNFVARRLYSRRGYIVVKPDLGEWSYYDHNGVMQKMHEPGWRMKKLLK